jgi:hypothetical protein
LIRAATLASRHAVPLHQDSVGSGTKDGRKRPQRERQPPARGDRDRVSGWLADRPAPWNIARQDAQGNTFRQALDEPDIRSALDNETDTHLVRVAGHAVIATALWSSLAKSSFTASH